MKAFIAAVSLLIVILAVITLHILNIVGLRNDLSARLDDIKAAADADNWSAVSSGISGLDEKWESNSFWLSVTLSTTEVEAADLLIHRMDQYAALRDADNFYGEYVSLRDLVDYLPTHEGLSWKILL